ncbi:phage terminase large subunit [Salinarimonas soli]|uniref:Phage terminase large subunit n=1 Tax=Salinarimonas soli TaxID=1638099 RepID=A0A5B2VFE4_9HYPH|nr:phage terminase large subunit [Salinarimonas soli]KAA2237684.1 phage terminase large subunit [Salinarimonas soli]
MSETPFERSLSAALADPLAGLRELDRLDCEASHLAFACRFFEEREGSPFLVGPHHEVMCRTLDRVLSGEIQRLIINVPPGYTKTELAVIYFVARGLALNPRARFIHASFNGQLALENSNKIRDMIRLEGFRDLWPIRIRDDTDAKGLWRTEAGGGLMAAAAGGPITGFRAGTMEPGFTGALIIDDPLKPDDAASEIERTKINDRWHSTFKSRLAVETVPVIVIMQRLHVDDFSGFLLKGGSGEPWHHLLLPVLIDDDRPYPPEYTHGVQIPHGLPAGPLWPKKHDEARIETLRVHGYSFSGQYLQEPVLREGSLFKRHWFPVVPAAPAKAKRVRRWDLAATDEAAGNNADWTVGLRMSRDTDGVFYVEDVVRGRFSPRDVERLIVSTAGQDGFETQIVVPEDPGQAGKAQAQYLVGKLSGFIAKAMRETGSKETRALPAAAQAEAGNIRLVEGPWIGAFLEELTSFPSAAKDDQVDAFSGAFNELAVGGSFDLAQYLKIWGEQ